MEDIMTQAGGEGTPEGEAALAEAMLRQELGDDTGNREDSEDNES